MELLLLELLLFISKRAKTSSESTSTWQHGYKILFDTIQKWIVAEPDITLEEIFDRTSKFCNWDNRIHSLWKSIIFYLFTHEGILLNSILTSGFFMNETTHMTGWSTLYDKLKKFNMPGFTKGMKAATQTELAMLQAIAMAICVLIDPLFLTVICADDRREQTQLLLFQKHTSRASNHTRMGGKK